MPTNSKIETRPLRERNVVPSRNWHKLLIDWEETDDFRDLIGLLHQGYDVSLAEQGQNDPEYSKIDRHSFYLSQADGWQEFWLLDRAGELETHHTIGFDQHGYALTKTAGALRQDVARKAFDILCLRFFGEIKLKGGGRHGDGFNDVWERMIFSESLFPAILNFFRIEDRFGHMVIPNLPRLQEHESHKGKQAIQFLLNLAEFLWGWGGRTTYYVGTKNSLTSVDQDGFRARVENAKPWMIEILSALNQFNVLEKWVPLNDVCLAKFKEIAMRAKIGSGWIGSLNEPRNVQSLEEARYVGSKAAWFLEKHALIVKMRKRFRDL